MLRICAHDERQDFLLTAGKFWEMCLVYHNTSGSLSFWDTLESMCEAYYPDTSDCNMVRYVAGSNRS
jgi:hypothetical protein